MSTAHFEAGDRTERFDLATHREFIKPAHTVPLRDSPLCRKSNGVNSPRNRKDGSELTRLQVALQKAQEERDSEKERASELQQNVFCLTEELSALKREYQQLAEEKKREQESQTANVSSLERKLTEKDGECMKLNEQVTELQHNVKQMNLSLQLYSEHTVDGTISVLQKQVSELDGRVREREWEVQVLETRLSSQDHKHKKELQEDVQKMLSMKSAIASLESAVQAKDVQLTALTTESRELRESLSDKEEKLAQLNTFVESQTQQLKELREQKNALYEAMEKLGVDHEETVAALQQQLEEAKQAVEAREAHLERMVKELPDLPITRAVLDGYSRSHMLDSWIASTSFPPPGGIYQKDSDPVMEGAVELKPLV